MDIAVFATLKKLIGKKNDTCGTATDGTINRKLNAVISNTYASTSANASGTLSQKLSYLISSLIGTANASGGSATAGTDPVRCGCCTASLFSPDPAAEIQCLSPGLYPDQLLCHISDQWWAVYAECTSSF